MPDFTWPQAVVTCFALFCATLIVMASIGSGRTPSKPPDRGTLPSNWRPPESKH